MKIQSDIKLDFDDILLVPHRTKTASRKHVSIERQFQFYHSERNWNGIPLMGANMDTTGTFSMHHRLSSHNIITCLHKHYDIDEVIKYCQRYKSPDCLWFSMGIKERDFHRLYRLKDSLDHLPNICIDVANGYTDDFVDACADVRSFVNDSIIMAGNVCTADMVQELILHGGVDIVKVGIGPGSACTTRLKTGVGYPQLSAIMECSHAAHGLKSNDKKLGRICADGGCRNAGDICKAFAANADFVMLGGILSGTDECEGEWEYETEPLVLGVGQLPRGKSPSNRKKSLKFYGMSSKMAQEKHGSGLKDYRTSEGRILTVPYKGPVETIILDILGGLRSCCAYIGATSIKDMSKCAEFVQVSRTHFDQSL